MQAPTQRVTVKCHAHEQALTQWQILLLSIFNNLYKVTQLWWITASHFLLIAFSINCTKRRKRKKERKIKTGVSKPLFPYCLVLSWAQDWSWTGIFRLWKGTPFGYMVTNHKPWQEKLGVITQCLCRNRALAFKALNVVSGVISLFRSHQHSTGYVLLKCFAL